MIYTRKIRWVVDNQTASVLDEQSRIVNWLYNKLLERANELRQNYRDTQDREVGRQLYTKWGLRNLVPDLKQQYPFLNRVYSIPLKNAALRLSQNIRNYQDSEHGRRKGPKAKWPGFRKWQNDWFSLDYEDHWGFSVRGRHLAVRLGLDLDGHRMIVQGVLVAPFKLRYGDRLRKFRILKELGQFFAAFTVDRIAPQTKKRDVLRIIALDPNHKNLAYGVGTDGRAIEIENLKKLAQMDKRIDILRHRRDRCRRKSELATFTGEDGLVQEQWDPSRRWKYFNRKLEREQQKRHDETKKYLFTLANRLCKEYDVIGIGDYAPHGMGLGPAMRRALFNRSVIARFKKVVSWVCLRSGKVFLEYSEQGTTRTCHRCGHIIEEGLDPKIRDWECPNCGVRHLRDENAAMNGLERVMDQMHLPRSGHTPVMITARWTWRVTSSGVQVSRSDVAVQ